MFSFDLNFYFHHYFVFSSTSSSFLCRCRVPKDLRAPGHQGPEGGRRVVLPEPDAGGCQGAQGEGSPRRG